jgi:hypothetical protein
MEDAITTFISLVIAYGPDPPPELLEKGIELVFVDNTVPGHYMEVHVWTGSLRPSSL